MWISVQLCHQCGIILWVESQMSLTEGGGGIKYTENTFSQIKATYNPSYIILVACNLTPKLDLDDHS